MLSRLSPKQGQTMEQVRKQLDNVLEVSGWGAPGQAHRGDSNRDPRMPAWWDSPEEASNAFLRSMGVVL